MGKCRSRSDNTISSCNTRTIITTKLNSIGYEGLNVPLIATIKITHKIRLTMKVTLRTIAGLLSSAVMVSCSNVNDDPNISQTPIDFGTTVSRAAVADKRELSSFSVWGGYQ